MKPSHTTTPRLMRDGVWTSGSVSADVPPPLRLFDWVWALACVGACVAIGVMLAEAF